MGIKRIILIVLVILAMTGCQYHPAFSEASSVPAVSSSLSSESNSISDVYSQPSVPSGSPYTLEEYKTILQPHLNDDEYVGTVEEYNVYPSPDGKNQYIEIVVYLKYLDQDWFNYVGYLFINDFDHFVKDYNYEFIKTVKWIDNKRALIDRETIIDIETGQRHNIMDNSYFDHLEWSSIIESDVNAAGTKIATFNIRHFEDQNVIRNSKQYLFLYDIVKDKWILIFEISYFYEETGVPSALLKWKTDDCIEFYLHYGAKFNYTLSSGRITEVPNFLVKDYDVFDAARLRKDKGFAGEKTIYMWDVDNTISELCTYMEENNFKIAPGEYCIYNKDTYEDLIKKLCFVPNK